MFACEPRECSLASDRHAARCFFALFFSVPVPTLAVIARVAVGIAVLRLGVYFHKWFKVHPA